MLDLAAMARRLQLTRPIVFTDIEGTGLNPRVARIVDFGVVKLYPDGRHTVFDTLVNPGVPIPPQVTAVHGITDAMVADAPTWRDVGPKVAGGLVGCDLVAYAGRRYDLDILRAEMARHQIPNDLATASLVDPLAIWARLEPRNLDAYLARFGGGERRAAAHRAGADVAALVVAFQGQLDAMGLPDNVPALVELSRDPSWIDRDGKLAWMGGRPCVTFGKHRGEALQDLSHGSLRWFLGSDQDFSDEVKGIVRAAIGGRFPTPPAQLSAGDIGAEAD